MSRADTAAIVLAAGKGTRFKSDLAKVLHRAAGRTMLHSILEALRPLELGQVVVVVGHQRDDVEAEARSAGLDHLVTVVQEEQLGTGHAAGIGLEPLNDGIERVMVLPGDTPLLTSATLEGLLDAATGDHDGALLTIELEDPTGYGRVIREDGDVARIVEEEDATDEQRRIGEVNAGMYVLPRAALADAVGELDADNAQGELYLTDVAEVLAGRGVRIAGHAAPADEVAGVNDRSQLAEAAAVLRQRVLQRLMEDGVTVIDPATTYVDVDVEIGVDTVVLPGCVLEQGTRIGSGVSLGPNCRLRGTTVEDGAEVTYTVAFDASIGPDATVGPFTYLRPGTRLERGAKAGGFVEVKKSTIGQDAKVPHLSYVGDAEIGAGVNFSAGAITVNYDGTDKHRTVVEDGAFVGCDTMLVAPVTVGAGAFVAAGSTITDDVPPDALAIARQRQTNKEGWAADRREAEDR